MSNRRIALASVRLQERMAAMRRHALAFGLATVTIVAMPLGAALLHDAFRVDSFDPDAAHAVDQGVAALLKGEDLVAPPPLPPEFFMTPEVEEWQPLARSASRQWSLLDDAFRQRLFLGFRLMHEQYGYDMVPVEGYRSPQRQAELAARGPLVTRAGRSRAITSSGSRPIAPSCATDGS